MEYKYLDHNYYLNNKSNFFRNIKLKKYINSNNSLYINNKDIRVNNYILDKNQMEAVYTDEINTLVLAGAGSGKTLTIEGKTNYLIEQRHINENEILCISFTNESVNSLRSRIKYNIDIYTFHKLALEIINDYKISIYLDNDYLSYIINEIFLSTAQNIDEKILSYFNNEITSFISIFKNHNYDYKYMERLSKNNKLIRLIKYIYLIYEDELRSTNYVDFNDIINMATRLIESKGLKRFYKYIIIDEYQDISDNRYKLIKAIKESCRSKLFAVGDDYQSIYKFSGSNLNMITKFKKYYGYTRVIKIVNTYRNSIELINTANTFIIKNRYQIKKKLLSNKHLEKPIKIIYYKKNESIIFKKLLELISGKVLILGRNTFDVNYVLNDEITFKDNKIIYKKEYDYKTVHRSKGLEEDNIILINLNNSRYGFPNKKNDNITRVLLPKDRYLYEEERRLFYVALTRTKNYIYLLVDIDNPSTFVKELLRNSKKYIEVLDL